MPGDGEKSLGLILAGALFWTIAIVTALSVAGALLALFVMMMPLPTPVSCSLLLLIFVSAVIYERRTP